jgi:hypothetical protein
MYGVRSAESSVPSSKPSPHFSIVHHLRVQHYHLFPPADPNPILHIEWVASIIVHDASRERGWNPRTLHWSSPLGLDASRPVVSGRSVRTWSTMCIPFPRCRGPHGEVPTRALVHTSHGIDQYDIAGQSPHWNCPFTRITSIRLSIKARTDHIYRHVVF